MMKRKSTILALLNIIIFSISSFRQGEDERFIAQIIDPTKSNVELFWKDDSGNILGSIKNLKSYVESKNKHLRFAMNGGMYMENQSALGLFIQHQNQIKKINTATGNGNFYMKPNGIFYITTNKKAFVCTTEKFKMNSDIDYATQSGPMLLIDGKVNSLFSATSKNTYVRNGVGIMADGKIVFMISKYPVTFYDLASQFKEAGCTNALYLDGFVSRMYSPENHIEQLDGNFGVMIGVTD